jgi:hypothetical protein
MPLSLGKGGAKMNAAREVARNQSLARNIRRNWSALSALRCVSGGPERIRPSAGWRVARENGPAAYTVNGAVYLFPASLLDE